MEIGWVPLYVSETLEGKVRVVPYNNESIYVIQYEFENRKDPKENMVDALTLGSGSLSFLSTDSAFEKQMFIQTMYNIHINTWPLDFNRTISYHFTK